MDLYILRHVAKEILAVAVCELFPTVQLIRGEVDEIGFSYTFYFPESQFNSQQLMLVEDRMIQIVFEDRPIKELEMMRENAATYLEHLGQPIRAQAVLESTSNIISLIEIGIFRDLCPSPILKTTKELKAFKLLSFKVESDLVRIYGTAFHDKEGLKAYLKKYKQALKKERLKEKYLIAFDDSWIYLGRGERIVQKLRKFWEKNHTDWEHIIFSDSLDSAEAHKKILEKKKYKYLASFSLAKGDYETIQCDDEQELFESFISSLHFIEKAYKIFPFELRIYCVEPKLGWLSSACKQAGLPFERELSADSVAHIAFRVADEYGREKTFSYLKVERKTQVLHRSLFYSLKEWVAQILEMGENFEFSY